MPVLYFSFTLQLLYTILKGNNLNFMSFFSGRTYFFMYMKTYSNMMYLMEKLSSPVIQKINSLLRAFF